MYDENSKNSYFAKDWNCKTGAFDASVLTFWTSRSFMHNFELKSSIDHNVKANVEQIGQYYLDFD